MKRIMIFLIIFSFVPVFAGSGSFGYEGFTIGESKAKILNMVKTRYNWYQIDYKQKNIYSGCNDIIVTSGSGADERKITFQFDLNQKLYLIIVTIKNPEDKIVEDMMNGIKQKYGNPTANDNPNIFLWDIENEKYLISFTTSPFQITSYTQKYSFFEMRYWDREAHDNVYDHDI